MNFRIFRERETTKICVGSQRKMPPSGISGKRKTKDRGNLSSLRKKMNKYWERGEIRLEKKGIFWNDVLFVGIILSKSEKKSYLKRKKKWRGKGLCIGKVGERVDHTFKKRGQNQRRIDFWTTKVFAFCFAENKGGREKAATRQWRFVRFQIILIFFSTEGISPLNNATFFFLLPACYIKSPTAMT